MPVQWRQVKGQLYHWGHGQDYQLYNAKVSEPGVGSIGADAVYVHQQ